MTLHDASPTPRPEFDQTVRSSPCSPCSPCLENLIRMEIAYQTNCPHLTKLNYQLTLCHISQARPKEGSKENQQNVADHWSGS